MGFNSLLSYLETKRRLGAVCKERRLSISALDYILFLGLNSSSKITVGELARGMGIDNLGAVSNSVTNLRDSGLVYKVEDSIDQRKRLVGLTQEGIVLYRQLAKS